MIYFITETYLKVNTPITANVDVTDVTPYIATQAQLRVMPILGTTYYNYLLGAYNAQFTIFVAKNVTDMKDRIETVDVSKEETEKLIEEAKQLTKELQK